MFFAKINSLLKTLYLYKNWLLILGSSFRMTKKWPAICHLRNGIKYEVKDASDIHILKEIWTFNHYGKFLNNITDGAIVVDVGAHIGIFSVMAAKQAKNVKVFSFEPLPKNFQSLKKNVKLNNLEDSVNCFQMAVACKAGERILNVIERTGSSITNDFGGRFSEAIKVPAVSLETVFGSNFIQRCHFLKIDCEGAEYEILYNTSPDILRHIETMTVETHDYERDKKDELKNFLTKNGFEVWLAKADLPGKAPAIWTNLLFAQNKNL